MKEFKVNDYITLKLEGGKTNVYVKGRLFNQCHFLLLNIPIEKITSFDEIESIDEAAEKLDRSLEGRGPGEFKIPPEVEFWGHCSNLQVWAEMDYDTRLLHRNIAFPLLKRLTEVGDPLAKKVFLDEIKKRVIKGTPQVVLYLIENEYTQYLLDDDVKLNVLQNNQSLKKHFTSHLHQYKKAFFPFLNLFIKLHDFTAEKILKDFVYDCLEKEDYRMIFFLKVEGYERFLPEGTFEFFKDTESITLHDLGLKEIPDLAQFYKLKELNLTSNEITEIKNLDNLKNLIKLDLFSNEISEIKDLDHLENLKYLDLSFNKITEIKGLDNLANLEKLHLSFNKYKKIKGLDNLTKLKELTLNLLGDMKLEGLHNLNNLENLAFYFDEGFHDLLNELGGIDFEHGRVYEPQKIVDYCKTSIILENSFDDTEIDNLNIIMIKKLVEKGNKKAEEIYEQKLIDLIEEASPELIIAYMNKKEKFLELKISKNIKKEGIDYVDKLFNSLADGFYLSSFKNYLSIYKDPDKNLIWSENINLTEIFLLYCFFHEDLMDYPETREYSSKEVNFYQLIWKSLRKHIYFDVRKYPEIINDLILLIKDPRKYYDPLARFEDKGTSEEDYREIVPYIFEDSEFNKEILMPIFYEILKDGNLKKNLINEMLKLKEDNEYCLYFLSTLLLDLLTDKREEVQRLLSKVNLDFTDFMWE